MSLRDGGESLALHFSCALKVTVNSSLKRPKTKLSDVMQSTLKFKTRPSFLSSAVLTETYPEDSSNLTPDFSS